MKSYASIFVLGLVFGFGLVRGYHALGQSGGVDPLIQTGIEGETITPDGTTKTILSENEKEVLWAEKFISENKYPLPSKPDPVQTYEQLKGRIDILDKKLSEYAKELDICNSVPRTVRVPVDWIR